MIEIIEKKAEGQEDSFFYDEEIACVEKANGTKLSLMATGDVNIRIGEDHFKNLQRFEAITKYDLIDKTLKSLDEKGEIEWINNNWFEVMYLPKGAEYWESVDCDVAHDYSSAIQLLKDYEADEEF